MKLLLALSLLFSFTTSDEFCNGYKRGYVKGYCYGSVYCVEPIPPICPIREYWEDNTYGAGYNRGFAEGIEDRDE